MIMGDIPNIPLHMSALMIYETGGKRGANALYKSMLESFDEIVERHFPILRCRVEGVAMQLDKAYWVDDPTYDHSYHISRVALPKPQDWAEVYRLFAQFHTQPLDRTRPLWEVLFVEGLDRLEGVPRGSTALFFKIHHAVMDGKSALRLIAGLHSPDPDPDSPTFIEREPDEGDHDRDFKAPAWWEKYGRAWWHSIERPLDLAATLLKVLPAFLQSGGGEARDDKTGVAQVRFNGPVSADRVVGHVRLDMQQVRAIEKKYHCTINELALCLVAGALRKYLLEEKELPAESLQALMPIDIRREGKDGHIGNHVSVAKVSLYSDIESGGERLAAIVSDSGRAKKHRDKNESHEMLRLIDDIHPAIIIWLGQWLISSGYMDRLPPLVNTVVTNVPGMKTEAWLAGARLIDYLGFGPLAPNMGLFHTVSSTPGHVNVSFLSTRELMDNGDAYTAALAASWDELRFPE
jgi:WS/DGAT/MGAT family acyltransferase